MAKEYLDLPMYKRHKLIIDYNRFSPMKDEIEEFLADEDFTKTRDFAKKVMFPGEVKSNNTIEGITSDIIFIEQVIKDAEQIKGKHQKEIINLYKGYKYILTHRKMDEEHLSELYHILSAGLLNPEDLSKMGENYRGAKVLVHFNGRLLKNYDEGGLEGTIADECYGLPSNEIVAFVDSYFDFTNKKEDFTLLTDYYIKSQIMHFYLEYIHPYFDVNSRTSRTMAMWYLLNNESYPFLIFNRAITFHHTEYERCLMDAKKYSDITFFVNYMLRNVKVELEKEHVMHDIRESTPAKLSAVDYQTLIYLLSMNDDMNALNFMTMFRRFNDSKKPEEIYAEMLDSLIEKGILVIDRETNKPMFRDVPNQEFHLNESRFDKDSPKIKRLNLQNK
jgi:Fic family protein